MDDGDVSIPQQISDILRTKIRWGHLTPLWRGVPFWSPNPWGVIELWDPFGPHNRLPTIPLQRPIVLVYARYEHDHSCHFARQFRWTRTSMRRLRPARVFRITKSGGRGRLRLEFEHCWSMMISVFISWEEVSLTQHDLWSICLGPYSTSKTDEIPTALNDSPLRE